MSGLNLTERETKMRAMLIEERKKHLLAMDDAYPDVGMGLLPFVAEKEAVEQIDKELLERLT